MVPPPKPRLAVILVMILTLGVTLGLPAEDVLDSIYDESEALPYEDIPLFSIAVRPLAARTAQPPPSAHPKLLAPSPFVPAQVRNIDVQRSTDARVSSAQLCILLC